MTPQSPLNLKNFSCLRSFAIQLADKGDLAPLENLMKKNPEVLLERDENGATPLHHAAAGGCVALILFIAAAVDPDGRHRPLAEIQHIYILCNLNADPFVGSSTFGVCLDALCPLRVEQL